MAGEGTLIPAAARLPVAAAALSLLTSACIDFVEVEHSGPAEVASLDVSVHVVQDSSLCVGSCRFPDGTPVPPGGDGTLAWVTAALDPGTDAGGVPRALLDSTLMVAGHEIPVHGVLESGEVRYRGTLPVAVDTLARVQLTLRPPALEGVVGLPPALSWYPPARGGQDTVPVRPGEEVRLDVQPPAEEPDPDLAFASWTLSLSGESDIRIGATGLPPTVLRVPAYYIPQPADGSVRARLGVFAGAVFLPAPADLATTVVLDVTLGWVLLPTP